MSEKLTAYRGEMFPSQQEGEVPQQNYGIDPNTGLPVQGWQQGAQGHSSGGQAADQGYYQQDQYQQPDPYAQAHQGFGGQQGHYVAQDQAGAVADPYNQATHSQYAAQVSGQTQVADPYAQPQYDQTQYDQSAYENAAQYGQVDHTQAQITAGQQQDYYNQQAAGTQDFGQYNGGYVEEVDPYMAAHQNATPPFDPAAHPSNSYVQHQEQPVYAQQYIDPNAVYNDPQQQYYQQAQVDMGQSPALYNDGHNGHDVNYQQGMAAGLPAPEGYGLGQGQQQYGEYAAAGDYNSQFGAQPLQPVQQGMQQVNDPYGQVADASMISAAQNEAHYANDVQKSGRKSFLVGTMILGSVIIGGGVAFAYKYSGDVTGDKAPVITSENGGVKVQPENPGGREFANQNKKIFARLGDPGAQLAAGAIVSTGDPDVVESLRGEIRDTAGVRADDAVAQPADPNGGPRIVKTYRIDRNGKQIIDSGARRVALAGTDVKDMAGVAVDTGKPARTVRTFKAGAAVKQVALRNSRVPATNKVASADGDFVVQVSARRTQQDALAAFSGLKQKYGSVLGGYRPLIQRADLGSRGIWFRLRVGPMKTKEDAASVCSQLKSSGLKNCLVASR